jgi:hypothetical protein
VPSDDPGAVDVLAAAIETLSGPGCVVLDDVHLLPGDVVDAVVRTAAAALPDEWRLVVCTRGPLPDGLLRCEATGRAVVLGAEDLVYDEVECAQVHRSSPGLDVYASTGGWPLAVALWTRAAQSDAPAPAGQPRHVGVLADLVLADVAPELRHLLVVLARLPRFPRALVTHTDVVRAGVDAFVRSHPELTFGDDEWCSLREWLRSALAELPAVPSIVDAVAQILDDLDETDLAARLFLSEGRFGEAVPRIERLAANALRHGRAAWARAVVAPVPSSKRTFELELMSAGAAQALSLVDPRIPDAASEERLAALVERATHGSGSVLRARALLASHYRMEADGRVLTVCEEALADALTVDAPERDLLDRWPAAEVPAAAELLRYYGHALLFAPDQHTIQRGQRLISAALRLLARAALPTASLQAWSAYFEALLFLQRPADALRLVRLTAHRMAAEGHTDAAVRLAELATLEFFADERVAARHTIELARVHAARTGNHIALAPLAAIDVGLEVFASPFSSTHAERFRIATDLLDSDARLAHFTALITAEFGVVLVRQGHGDVARPYLEQAERALDHSFFAHTARLRCRRLAGLLLLAEGSPGGPALLQALADDALAEGRPALAEQITVDLANWQRTVNCVSAHASRVAD